MFKNLQPLKRSLHSEMRLSHKQPYHFASDLTLAPITAGEAAMLAREYTIVFSLEDQAPPIVLLGVRKRVNAYIGPSGTWLARYVPAHVRRYPFMLAEGPAPRADGLDERQFTLLFDADAPHLSGAAGERLFTQDGEPSAALDRVREVLVSLQRDLGRTVRMVERLHAANLLVERTLMLRGAPEKGLKLEGVRVIDTDKLVASSADVLQDLRDSGALMLIYAHLISLSNLRDGALARGPAASTGQQIAGDVISFEGVDWDQLGGGPGKVSSH
ncbi:SapC family protein [Thiorhodococcus mannitoliphagus]|uniref:SapC family protein n=1 Tax=Thiorhodococcus mannitoliphagus TaxID=329406 RepID=A0A6P1DYN8_9GAMM|nr:SapC family protein [Thiorhodococcus mannitoliphagus]NEX21826.1 SapC family protein [Thiorhodococcus mannitoliphagus]